ncbi:MAG: HAMP domain-containing protein [Bacteroidetes bacterium]|nr:HAMP domain-containing protein [Bacteroidota bacterium]
MNISFKNRIAFQYLTATAVVIAIVFTTVFFIVRGIVYENLDSDLAKDAQRHVSEIVFENNAIRFNNKDEWEEREHREAESNPVFIQIIDSNGTLMDKSPNLKEQTLQFNPTDQHWIHYNARLNDRYLRQVQLPIILKGKTVGHIIAAISIEGSMTVIRRLKNVLLLSYPIILFCLFIISQFLAGRSIQPLKNITRSVGNISRKNLKERIPLPNNQDELYALATAFNALLNRMNDAFEREQQFTSDASHQLRTPLSVIQGNLEVLIRKPRKTEEYENEIRFCLKEIESLSKMVDQLLASARSESVTGSNSDEKQNVETAIRSLLNKYDGLINEKKLKIKIQLTEDFEIPVHHGNLILENIFENAIKYSRNSGEIRVQCYTKNNNGICEITDEGIGISEEDMRNIFNPFFRSNSTESKSIKGSGLGLSIARKSADAIGAEIKIKSKPDVGTEVEIEFVKH